MLSHTNNTPVFLINTQSVMNTVKFQTVKNFIVRQADKEAFSGDTARKLVSGQLILRDNTDYIRKEVAASPSGTVKLIDANTNITPGVSTFVGNKKDKSVNQVITHMRLAYGTDEYSGQEASVDFSNTQSDVPAALRSATVIISQDGKPVIKLPAMDFITPGNDGKSAYAELSAFAMIKEEQTFGVELEFADGVSLGAGKHYIELALKGMSTFEK